MTKKTTERQKKTKEWFVKNIILPNNEIIDKPGFIVYQFEVKGKNAFMREILFPEEMLSCIETKTKEKLGADALYRAGKRWGLRFARGALFPQKSKKSEKEIIAFFEDFSKFCEAVYSTEFKIEKIDLKNKELKLSGKDVIVCSIGSVGEVFLGAWVGVWNYVNEENEIEGIQIDCQGNGKSQCTFQIGPKIKRKIEIENQEGLKIEGEFYKLNTPHLFKSEFSLARYLELGRIKYEGGFFKINEGRLVLHEASSIYFIENELKKVNEDKIVFECAFDFFYKFAKGKTKEHLIGFLMATGWGQIEIFKNKGKYIAKISNFPWVKLDINFQMICGAFSGFLSAIEKRKITLQKKQILTTNNYLEITLEERN